MDNKEQKAAALSEKIADLAGELLPLQDHLRRAAIDWNSAKCRFWNVQFEAQLAEDTARRAAPDEQQAKWLNKLDKLLGAQQSAWYALERVEHSKERIRHQIQIKENERLNTKEALQQIRQELAEEKWQDAVQPSKHF